MTALLKDGEAISKVLSLLSRLSSTNIQLMWKFCCILPGHNDKDPSAAIYINPKTRMPVYFDFHRKSGYPTYNLVEVYAALKCERLLRLNPPSLATWELKMLVEAGILESAHVEHRSLPEGISGTTKKVYKGFIELLGCKWIYDHGKPTVFGRKFASAWCKVTEWEAREAIRELLRLGYIRVVGKHKRRMTFLPRLER